MHTLVDLELLDYINMDLKWNIMRKGRTSITRRPKKPGTHNFELGNKIPEPAAFVTKKPGTEKVVDAPLKRRRLMHQPTSPPPHSLCLNGEGGLSPGPQTPAVYNENSGQKCRSNSLSKSQKTKSKTRLRKTKLLKPTKKELLDPSDFSGIELLAAAACSSFIQDNANHVDDVAVLIENTTPVDNSCKVMIPDKQNLHDNVKGEEDKLAPSKALRLHWDLNTVMDEWEEPFDDLVVEGAEAASTVDGVYANQLSVKHDAAISVMPLVGNGNGDSFGKTYELMEKLTCSQEVVDTKTITGKASDVESSVTASKSDVVDSLIHPVKCEDITTTSTTSILRAQSIVKVESDTMCKFEQQEQQPVSEEVMQGVCQSPELCKAYCDNKVTSEDPASECCGSNVTQDEQGHMAEGDSEDKIQAGYDSPFEDGELREPISVNIYKDEFGTIGNSMSEVKESHDLGQTMETQSSLLVKDAVPETDIKQDAFKSAHIDEPRPLGGNLFHIDASTSFDVCRNGAYEQRSRSSNIGDSNSRYGRDSGVGRSIGRDNVSIPDRSRNNMSGPCVDSSMRDWDLRNNRSLDINHHSRNHYPRGGGGGGYRRTSPFERNNGYGSSRGPPERSLSRDRYRVGSGFYSKEYRGPKPCYLDRKPRYSTNNHLPRRTRSRSRSRSGSPIAWHFQKRKNPDTSISGEIEATTRSNVASPERSSKCFDDKRSRDDTHFRDNRQLSGTSPRNRRFDPIGYPERLKSDDHFRFAKSPARFSQMTDYKYKDSSYEKHGDGGGVRRFRYAGDDSFETRNRHNFNSFSKDDRKEHTTVLPASKS